MITKKSFRLTLISAALVFGMLIAACNDISPVYEGQPLDGLWVSASDKYVCFQGEWSKFNSNDEEIARGILPLRITSSIITFTQTYGISVISNRLTRLPTIPATTFNVSLSNNKTTFTAGGRIYRLQ